MQQEMLTAEFSFSKNDFSTLSRIFTEVYAYRRLSDDNRDYQFSGLMMMLQLDGFISFLSCALIFCL